MKRFIIGALAVIGGLLAAHVLRPHPLLIIGASQQADGAGASRCWSWIWTSRCPSTCRSDSLAGAFGEEQTTVRDVVDALEKAGDGRAGEGAAGARAGSPAAWRAVQELRDAVKAFRATGKKAIAYADTFGEFSNATGAYYLASAFDEVYVQPSGDVNLTGLALETPFARDAFAKLGRAAAASASATSTRTPSTPTPSRATRRRTARRWRSYLGSLYGQMVRGIAEDRKLSRGRGAGAASTGRRCWARRRWRRSWWTGCSTATRCWTEGEEGRRARARSCSTWTSTWSARAGRTPTGTRRSRSSTAWAGCRAARATPTRCGGEADDGRGQRGGGARKAIEDEQGEGDRLPRGQPGRQLRGQRHRAPRGAARAGEGQARHRHAWAPTRRAAATSSSMDADKIVAQPGTLTGSIGVFGGKMVTADFWEKLGVNWETDRAWARTPRMYSSDSDVHAGAAARKNEAMLDRIYADFTSGRRRGASCRWRSCRRWRKGRVWTGEDAKANGLVDELGGFPQALGWPRRRRSCRGRRTCDVQVFPRKKSPAEVLAELLGGGGDNSDEDVGGVRTVASRRCSTGRASAVAHRAAAGRGRGRGAARARADRAAGVPGSRHPLPLGEGRGEGPVNRDPCGSGPSPSGRGRAGNGATTATEKCARSLPAGYSRELRREQTNAEQLPVAPAPLPPARRREVPPAARARPVHPGLPLRGAGPGRGAGRRPARAARASAGTRSARASWRATGLRVLRFSNREVLGETEAVLQQVYTVLNPLPRPDPLPEGEGNVRTSAMRRA